MAQSQMTTSSTSLFSLHTETAAKQHGSKIALSNFGHRSLPQALHTKVNASALDVTSQRDLSLAITAWSQMHILERSTPFITRFLQQDMDLIKLEPSSILQAPNTRPCQRLSVKAELLSRAISHPLHGLETRISIGVKLIPSIGR